MSNKPEFSRKVVLCNGKQEKNSQLSLVTANNQEQLCVLVVNSSQEMAQEITLQLTLAIPGCSIMYAPTLAVARLLLARRKLISLVVSSAVLPDGNVSRLQEELEKLPSPPDLVVVNENSHGTIQLPTCQGYRFATAQRIKGEQPIIVRRDANHDNKIRSLGADLRNDLNNPLQEIVACVFVAQATSELAPATNQALKAIEQAAQNMANVVGKLEDRIRQSVNGE